MAPDLARVASIVPRTSAALLAVLLALGAPAGPQAVADAREGEMAALLATIGPDVGAKELARHARALAAAPGAAEAFLEIASAGGIPAADGGAVTRLTASQRRALLRAAPRLSRSEVAQAIGHGAALRRDPAWRLVAVHLLEFHGTASEIPLLVTVTLNLDGTTPERGALLDAFRTALARIIPRDPGSFHQISMLPPIPIPLQTAVARAVGAAGDAEGLAWLAGLLDELLLTGPALQELGRLAPRASRDLALETATRIRPFLRHKNPSLRKHAMHALAALQDVASVPGLIAILDEGTTGERKSALSALRKLTGRDLPAHASIWRVWYQEEQRWLREEGATALDRLTSEKDSDVVAAVRVLSERSFYRDRVAAELTKLVGGHASPTIRSQVCLALGRLGSREALFELVRALDDPEEAVCGSAWSALRSITGFSLPAESGAWEEALHTQ